MRGVVIHSLAVVVALLAGSAVTMASPQSVNPSQDQQASYLRVHGVTQPPHGFVEFCSRDPRHCLEGRYDNSERPDYKAGIAQLNRINRQANSEIEPATDMEIYGVPEYWTLPMTRGDCEDYALLKRHRLIAAGWPASSLLMTVVLDEANEGHAVLTVRTSEGDYILDNKNSDIKLWNQTPYRFLMRQSYLNPQVWMSLDPSKAQPSVPVVGVAMPR